MGDFGPRSGTVAARHCNAGTPHITLSAGMCLASRGNHHSVHEVAHSVAGDHEAHSCAMKSVVSSGDSERNAPEPPHLLPRSIALARATCRCEWTDALAVSGADGLEGLILGHSAASLRAVRRFSSVARVVPAEWVGWRAHVRDRNVYLAVWCHLAHCWPHSARPSHIVPPRVCPSCH